jgi:hypothetical protein
MCSASILVNQPINSEIDKKNEEKLIEENRNFRKQRTPIKMPRNLSHKENIFELPEEKDSPQSRKIWQTPNKNLEIPKRQTSLSKLKIKKEKELDDMDPVEKITAKRKILFSQMIAKIENLECTLKRQNSNISKTPEQILKDDDDNIALFDLFDNLDLEKQKNKGIEKYSKILRKLEGEQSELKPNKENVKILKRELRDQCKRTIKIYSNFYNIEKKSRQVRKDVLDIVFKKAKLFLNALVEGRFETWCELLHVDEEDQKELKRFEKMAKRVIYCVEEQEKGVDFEVARKVCGEILDVSIFINFRL